MTGKVWLVGAGPSDVGLLTIKGKEVLERAQVVVYDALVGSGILSLIPPEAEKINAGKRSSRHTLPQEDTNRILLEKALEGKRVVRLKGGDPFLFGRGGEELEILAENGVPFEVVPGVTSAVSVPAYNGIPVTHRGFASSVHIIAGHKKKNEPLDINFKALAEAGGTLVFLMGTANLEEICRGLTAGGMDPDTPAAVLQKGASAEQRAVTGNLVSLPKLAAEQGVEMPAIIVVGGVCLLRDKLKWMEKQPLFGCRVALTRPRERMGSISARLRQMGAQVIELPTISTRRIEGNKALSEAVENIKDYAWTVFTSPAGVDIFFDELKKSGRDARSLANMKFAVIGGGTAKRLAERGINADLVPEIFDGRHLGAKLRERIKDGEKILIPRAKIGSAELIEELKKAKNAEINDLPVYDTVYESIETPNVREEFEQHPQTAAVFTSASTVRGFAEAARGLDFKKVTALCIGRQTACEAERLGMKAYTAEQASIESLCELIERYHGLNMPG